MKDLSDLILYLGVTIIGYFAGSQIRSRKDSFQWTGKVQLLALILMVFLMGMRMGANREVTENISSIGLSSFLMTVATMLCSVLAIFVARRIMGIDRYGRLQPKKSADRDCSENQISEEAFESLETQVEQMEEKEKSGSNHMTVAVLLSVGIGLVIGYFVIRSAFASYMEQFDSLAGIGIKIGLCLLLFFVGLDLGIEGTVVQNFRQVGLRILAFPIAVILGTLLGALLCSFVVDISTRECLAVGAGFGWYTLAPGIIMESGYVTASAVSFLHNIMRELFSIILIPVVAKKIGYIETTGLPGAAAMDVCLPVVERATRSDIAVYSFLSGVTLSILVPVLVPFLIG